MPLGTNNTKPPTKKHRPALVECMLGTVYAINDKGEARYFDYKWRDAWAFAGIKKLNGGTSIDAAHDARWSKAPKDRRHCQWVTKGCTEVNNSLKYKHALWILK